MPAQSTPVKDKPKPPTQNSKRENHKDGRKGDKK